MDKNNVLECDEEIFKLIKLGLTPPEDPCIMVYVAGKLNSDKPTVYAENMYNMTFVCSKIETYFDNVFTYNPGLMIAQGLVSGVFDEQSTYIQKGLCFLEMCDVMVVLPGSESSYGTNVEIKHATDWSIPIVYLDEDYNLDGLKRTFNRLLEENDL